MGSTKPPLLVWGASGHALVVADAVRCEGKYEIVGFIDDISPERAGTKFGGARVLGGRDQLALMLAKQVSHLIVAVGDNTVRTRLAAAAREAGFELARAIHPRAVVAADATIGPGTLVAAGAVINAAAKIGENAIVNTSCIIEHECSIGDGAHVGPGARLGGRARVGAAAWIGIGATVIDRVAIGARSVIGAGAVVLEDVPDGVVAYGVPARVVRKAAHAT